MEPLKAVTRLSHQRRLFDDKKNSLSSAWFNNAGGKLMRRSKKTAVGYDYCRRKFQTFCLHTLTHFCD